MSLPRLFQTTIETIPGKVPYLAAPACPNCLAGPKDHLRVGLAWAGNTSSDDLAKRSINLEELTPLIETPEVTFYSLQVPVPPQDELRVRSLPNLVNLGPYLTDFRQTAAMIGQLDLVITVDTAVAHLAGALGKPTWTFLIHSPDWRWLLERSDSPWYPTMRLFRQTERDQWLPTIRIVAEELRCFATQQRSNVRELEL